MYLPHEMHCIFVTVLIACQCRAGLLSMDWAVGLLHASAELVHTCAVCRSWTIPFSWDTAGKRVQKSLLTKPSPVLQKYGEQTQGSHKMKLYNSREARKQRWMGNSYKLRLHHKKVAACSSSSLERVGLVPCAYYHPLIDFWASGFSIPPQCISTEMDWSSVTLVLFFTLQDFSFSFRTVLNAVGLRGVRCSP